MKKSAILSAIFSLVILGASFAETITNTDSVKALKTVIKAKKPAPSLSEVEIAFFKEIDEYYYQTFEKPANKLMNPTEKLENRVIVYNLAGDVITTKKSEIPTNASFLMTEGETAYYIVSQ